MTTPTDAQVEAAITAFEAGEMWTETPDTRMRAALTAAFSLAPAGTVEVKPLEWHGDEANCSAKTSFGQYSIWRSHTGAFHAEGVFGQDAFAAAFTTAEGAKAAAQADLNARIAALLPPQPSAVTEAQAAYGLLWRMRTTDKAIHEARRSLLSAIGKDGQRAGLDWALATFGPHKAPTLEELP